jgi:hypothetical protein
MTGLLLLVVNVVVTDALFQVVQNSVPRTRAELRPVLSAKNIEVRDSTIENYEAFAICEVLAKGIIGNESLRAFWSIFNHGEIHRDRRTWAWEDHTNGIHSVMRMAWTEIEAKVLAFVQYSGNYIPFDDSGRSFPSVRHLSHYWDRRSVQRVTRWTWNTNPSSLIDPKSIDLGTPLEKIDKGGQEKQSGRYLSPKKLAVLVSGILVTGGFLLLFKIIDKVYLDPRFNINMAAGGFFLAIAMVWLDGWIIVSVFRFF